MEDAKLKWLQCKCSGNIHFLSPDEAVFACGSAIKVLNEDGERGRIIPSPKQGIQCLTADLSLKLLAASDNSSRTNIFIIESAESRVISEWETEKKCNYFTLQFVGKHSLVTLEGEPDYTLTLWNWGTSRELLRVPHHLPMDEGDVCTFSPHPADNRLFCFLQGEAVHFYEVDDSDELGGELQKIACSYLPLAGDRTGSTAISGHGVDKLTWFDKVSGQPSWGIHTDVLHSIPIMALCDSFASEAEVVRLYDSLERNGRLRSCCHCWLPKNKLLVGCTDGTVAVINFDESLTTVVHFIEIGVARDLLLAQLIVAMEINTTGLFVAKRNGKLSLVADIYQWQETVIFTAEESILSMKFSPDFKHLYIATVNGSMGVFETQNGDFRNVL